MKFPSQGFYRGTECKISNNTKKNKKKTEEEEDDDDNNRGCSSLISYANEIKYYKVQKFADKKETAY
jgi:hypothetical protein